MAEYRFIKKLMMIAVLMPAASIAQVYTSNVTYGKPAEAVFNANRVGGAGCIFEEPSVLGGVAQVKNLKGSGETCALILYLTQGSRAITTGQIYKITVPAAIATVSDSASKVAATVVVKTGFTIKDAAGNTEDFAPFNGQGDHFYPAQQTMVAEFVGGTRLIKSGNVATSFDSWVMIDNVKPGQEVKIQFPTGGVTLSEGSLNSPYGVVPMKVNQVVNLGKPLRITVDSVVKNAQSGAMYSAVQLLNPNGKVVFTTSARRLSADKMGSAGILRDVWQFTPDKSVVAGTYHVRYQLLNPNKQPLQISNLASQPVNDIGSFIKPYPGVIIGKVKLSRIGEGGMYVGMAFHNYWSPGFGVTPNAGPSQAVLGDIKLPFSFARTGANNLLAEAWWSVHVDGSARTVTYDWGKFDAWANKISPLASDVKSLLINFHRSPRSELDPDAQIKPPHIPDLSKVVYDTVKKYQGRTFAVECWNEPELQEFFLGDRVQLANVCQAVYNATKRVSKRIPVICPQTADPQLMGFMLSARTSDDKPITDYCDWVGAHIYNAFGDNASGQAYSNTRLADRLSLIRHRLKLWQVDGKPLAITEFGVDRARMTPAAWIGGSLEGMANEMKADAMYQAIDTLREAGVKAVGLYSYDHGAIPTLPGGYFWLTNATATSGPTAMNEMVVEKVKAAITEATPGVAAW